MSRRLDLRSPTFWAWASGIGGVLLAVSGLGGILLAGLPMLKEKWPPWLVIGLMILVAFGQIVQYRNTKRATIALQEERDKAKRELRGTTEENLRRVVKEKMERSSGFPKVPLAWGARVCDRDNEILLETTYNGLDLGRYPLVRTDGRQVAVIQGLAPSDRVAVRAFDRHPTSGCQYHLYFQLPQITTFAHVLSPDEEALLLTLLRAVVTDKILNYLSTRMLVLEAQGSTVPD